MPQLANCGADVAAAQLHMRRQRWEDAAAILDRVGDSENSAGVQVQRTVCRNLAALQIHRPEVYQAVITCTDEERYTVGPAAGAGGQRTVYYVAPGAPPLSLSAGNDPAASLARSLASVKQVIETGDALALSGIGDGYLLRHLAWNPPPLRFGREQPIYLYEPDARGLLACLALHDYTGPHGPIEQTRFAWFVGSQWRQRMERFFLDDYSNGLAHTDLRQSVRAAEITAAIQEVHVKVDARYQAMQREVEAYYASMPHEQWTAIFSSAPPRPPRVLLLTTRYSSVLRYSTRDAAEGLAALGCQTRLFIEPKTHQGLTPAALARLLLEFKPDLVFQLDHLRREWGAAFSSQLPFACWVQDHLPNLLTTTAGTALHRRDFILCGMPAMYIDRYDYPARQCMHMARLTRLPRLPARWSADGDDLVYVSTASSLAADRANQIVADAKGSSQERQLLDVCCRRIIEAYDRGESLPTTHLVGQLVRRAERELGIPIAGEQVRREIADILFDRLSNPLFRQQGLRWAVNVARRHGLRLAIYGPGWERHPEFAPFARGPVAYGGDLETLTRASRINLVLEPYFAPSHQRLLDAVAAGGFCLVRDHPSRTIFQDLANFLCAHPEVPAQAAPEVRAALSPPDRQLFDEILARWESVLALGDPVGYVRGALEAGKLVPRPSALPALDRVVFGNSDELEQRVLVYVGDAGVRNEIAQQQRLDVESRLSYATGMRRILQRIGSLIAAEGEQGQTT